MLYFEFADHLSKNDKYVELDKFAAWFPKNLVHDYDNFICENNKQEIVNAFRNNIEFITIFNELKSKYPNEKCFVCGKDSEKNNRVDCKFTHNYCTSCDMYFWYAANFNYKHGGKNIYAFEILSKNIDNDNCYVVYDKIEDKFFGIYKDKYLDFKIKNITLNKLVEKLT